MVGWEGLMPVCEVCGADGVIEVNNAWYCVEHADEAFLYVARLLAGFRGWDVAEVQELMMRWLEE
jgi:hypothetical protein